MHPVCFLICCYVTKAICAGKEVINSSDTMLIGRAALKDLFFLCTFLKG